MSFFQTWNEKKFRKFCKLHYFFIYIMFWLCLLEYIYETLYFEFVLKENGTEFEKFKAMAAFFMN